MPPVVVPGTCPETEARFEDVSVGSHTAGIDCVAALGVSTGTTAATFEPDKSVNRAQMATFLARLWKASGRECPERQSGFDDVDSAGTHASGVDCVAGLGVSTGKTSTEFEPAKAVTRAQMATFLARLWEATGRECPAETSKFADVGRRQHPQAGHRLRGGVGCQHRQDIHRVRACQGRDTGSDGHILGAFVAHTRRRPRLLARRGTVPHQQAPQSRMFV